MDNHLKETVADIEKKKKIDLIAIGIGHDVSKYYNNAFTIDDVEKLGEIIIDNLTEIIRDKRWLFLEDLDNISFFFFCFKVRLTFFEFIM